VIECAAPLYDAGKQMLFKHSFRASGSFLWQDGRALPEFSVEERSTTGAPVAASDQPSNGATFVLAMLSVAATLMVLMRGRQNSALLETLPHSGCGNSRGSKRYVSAKLVFLCACVHVRSARTPNYERFSRLRERRNYHRAFRTLDSAR